jgi:hypothetical protein
MDSKQKVALTFALYQGGQLVRRETLAQDIVKVGKDPKSHLRIDDEQASRMHAVIEVASVEDVTVIDLGNQPGTLVNGAVVNKCKVGVGDQIVIGGTTIVLERVEAADSQAVAPAAPSLSKAANPFEGAAAGPASNPFGANPFGAANPFAATASPFGDPFAGHAAAPVAHAHDEVPHDAPEGSYTYSMIQSAPSVPSEEVESAASSVEVMVLWGESVLHVAHLTPPRAFYVGESTAKGLECDYFIPAQKVGGDRVPLVVVDGGTPSAVLLPGASGTVEVGGQKQSLQDAIQSGKARPMGGMNGAHQLPLSTGTSVKVVLESGLTFKVSSVNAGRVVAGHVSMAGLAAPLGFFGLSAAVHGGLLAAMFFFMPALSGTEDGEMSADQQYLLKQMLQAAAEKEMEEKETEQVTETVADNKEGGTGTRAKGEEGSMGNPNTKSTGQRFGVKGPADNPDPHIARQAALRDAMEFGMIGLLNSGAGGDPDAPTAPWGRDDSLGTDELSARGNMWGDSIGDSFGAGGLGLSGIGEGGGGRGEGIGLGSIGTIGHGAGTGTGQGFGNGSGRLGGSHRTKPPSVRMGATSVSGRLPPEVIQRIVRQNFGRFRLCYENGLRNNPNLQGRVSVSFVISKEGAVNSVSGGGDLPDSGVINCVTKAFYGLSFPQPEGGVVKVSYPIMFAPGG